MNYTVSAKNLVLKMIRVMVMMMMIWMAVATAGSPSWPLRPPSGTTMPTIPTLSDDLGSESFSLIAHAQAEGLDPAGSSPHNYPLGSSLAGVGAGAGAGAWALHQMTADGNCQFRALAHHLLGNQELHSVVRAAVARRLIDNRRQYASRQYFLPDELVDYSEYVEGMTISGEWGDRLTLQVASDIYNVSINVVTSHGHDVIQPRNQDTEPGRTRWLLYERNHYNALTPTGERGPGAGAGANPTPARDQQPPDQQPPDRGQRSRVAQPSPSPPLATEWRRNDVEEGDEETEVVEEADDEEEMEEEEDETGEETEVVEETEEMEDETEVVEETEEMEDETDEEEEEMEDETDEEEEEEESVRRAGSKRPRRQAAVRRGAERRRRWERGPGAGARANRNPRAPRRGPPPGLVAAMMGHRYPTPTTTTTSIPGAGPGPGPGPWARANRNPRAPRRGPPPGLVAAMMGHRFEDDHDEGEGRGGGGRGGGG